LLQVPGVKRIEAMKKMLEDIKKDKIATIHNLYPESDFVLMADQEFNVIKLKQEYEAIKSEIAELEEKLTDKVNHIRSITYEGEFSCVLAKNFLPHLYSKTCKYGEYVLSKSQSKYGRIAELQEMVKKGIDKLWLCSTVEECIEIIKDVEDFEVRINNEG